MFRSMDKRGWFLACCLLTCCAALADEPSREHIVEGSMVHTAESNGRWRSWSNTGKAWIYAANKDAIWFGAGGMFWRYNIAEKKVDLRTPPLIESVEAMGGVVALSPAGRFAINSRGGILLWDTHHWRRLLPPAGMTRNVVPMFDEKENLWMTSDVWLSRWEDDRWSLFQKKIWGRLWNLGGEWYMHYSGSATESWKAAHSIWDAAMNEHRDINPGNDIQYFDIRFYAAGGWYGQGEQRAKGKAVVRSLFRVSTEGIVPKAKGDFFGLDLSTGEAFVY